MVSSGAIICGARQPPRAAVIARTRVDARLTMQIDPEALAHGLTGNLQKQRSSGDSESHIEER